MKNKLNKIEANSVKEEHVTLPQLIENIKIEGELINTPPIIVEQEEIEVKKEIKTQTPYLKYKLPV